jgi:major vault protein
MKDVHILDAYEELVVEKRIKVLSQNQYCIVKNPVGKNGKNEWGKQVVRKGECKFFLYPGEDIIGSIENLMVVSEDQALLVRAKVVYKDKRTSKTYQPG